MQDEKQVAEAAAAIDCESDGCKKPWQSWTLWASLLTAVVPLFPPAQIFLAAHPEVISAVGAIFGALRLKTSAPVQVKKAK